VDALSDVLAAIRLDGAVYIKAEFKAPWCVETQYGLHTAASRLPRSDHIVFFHLLTDGSCKARLVDGSEEFEVAAGDLLLFPHDHRHLLGTDLTLSPAPVGSDAIEGLIEMRWGGDGEATRFICGYLACDRRACRALLGPLPAMLCIPLGDISKSGWLADLLHLGVQESLAKQPGSQSLLAKLSEPAFIEALRRYAQSKPPDLKGWLAGLQDPHVGRALALLHGDPKRAWTVDELAREVALSRSALAERFTEMIGAPLMQYLTQWRLTLAAQALRAGSDGIARIAERSGYDSEAAFTRAFKREFGVPPTVWRKNEGSGTAGTSAGRSASA
jgi:AraC family transcriptional regulator, alkane utilization regulator